MKKVMNHKITKITYFVMSIILTVCFVLAVGNIVIRKGSLYFFLPGFLLSIILSIFVITVVESHKKEKLKNHKNHNVYCL